MIFVLNSLSENIIRLFGKLKVRSVVVDNEENKKIEYRMEEDTITDLTQSYLKWTYVKNHDKMVEEV